MIPKTYRLRKNSDFRITYKYGKSLATKNLVLYIRKNRLEESRIGFSISKKIGKANERNHIKRRCREILRHKLPDLKSGYDLIFIARIRIKELDFQGLDKNINYLLKKGRLFNEE